MIVGTICRKCFSVSRSYGGRTIDDIAQVHGHFSLTAEKTSVPKGRDNNKTIKKTHYKRGIE